MKFFFALLATMFLALPAWAADVQMGYDGGLVFEPAEVSVAAGEPIHFINNMLPPHNVVVEDHPEYSHEALAMLPGEDFEVVINEPGDYTYWCAPHKGAGMIGILHVSQPMSHNQLTKDELNVRVLKLKKMLYDGTYHEANADWHDGAHHMLNKILDVLDEYRY